MGRKSEPLNCIVAQPLNPERVFEALARILARQNGRELIEGSGVMREVQDEDLRC